MSSENGYVVYRLALCAQSHSIIILFGRFYLKNSEAGGKKSKKNQYTQWDNSIQSNKSHLQLCKISKLLGILNFTSVNSSD